jgi:hypothetical protein
LGELFQLTDPPSASSVDSPPSKLRTERGVWVFLLRVSRFCQGIAEGDGDRLSLSIPYPWNVTILNEISQQIILI